MNYKKELQLLQIEIEEYNAELERINDDFSKTEKKLQSRYSTRCNAVNKSIDDLYPQIHKLYKFLNNFGDIGERTTPFDRAYEESYAVEKDTRKFSDMQGPEVRRIGKKDAAFLLAGLPTALTCVAIHGISNKINNKKEYLAVRQEFEIKKSQNGNLKKEHREYISFLEFSIKLAEMYNATLTGIITLIDETILPELKKILAFLYASTIRNCILSGEDPNNREIESITQHENTSFHHYYVFVQNAHDYYNLINEFYRRAILTDIVSDREITKEEEREFRQLIDTIDSYKPKFKTNSTEGN